MMKLMKYIKGLVIVGAVLSGVMMTSCEDEPDKYEIADGLPTVNYIRMTDPEVADSLITGAYMSNTICLVGENLRSVYELYFNDQKAILNTSLITDNTLIVDIPSTIPSVVTNKIYLINKNHETVTYDFNVLVPAPEITSMSNEYAQPGTVATIYGDYFIDDPNIPLTVEIANVPVTEITSLTRNAISFVVPDGAETGYVNVESIYGTGQVGSYNPSSIPAGESLLINGQNLDLVASVTFGGGQTVAVSSSSASQLSVSVPMEAETGNIVLNMYNGETVEAPSLTITKPQCCYVMNLPEKVDAGALLELEVANGDKLTQVNVNGSQVQFILRDSKLMISLPAETVGEAALELVSSNGSISYQIEIVGSMGTLIYEGPLATGSWANSAQISSNMFATAQVGQVITVVVSDLQAGAQGSFKNSSWAAIAPGTEYFNIDGNFSLTITQDILTQLQSGGLIISGQNYTIESVYIK